MPITSSSISNSEAGAARGPAAPAGGADAAWAGFSRDAAVAAALLFLALWGAMLALDPYETGRFALIGRRGVVEQGPRTADASRARDPAFDSAIIGNSHIQLVAPERLDAATGLRFVSLTVPATGPREQLWMLDAFLRQHRRGAAAARAVVLGIDGTWCTADPDPAPSQPFPFWLYDPSPWRYAAGLLRWGSLEASLQRLLLLTRLTRRVRARPDGFWDYEQYRTWRPETNGAALARPEPSTFLNESGRFPVLDRLGVRLEALPAELAVVLVRPPVFVTSLPESGTALARSEEGCLAALRAAAARHRRAAVIDARTDRPETRVPEHFFDHTHYRAPLARALETEVATALRRVLDITLP